MTRATADASAPASAPADVRRRLRDAVRLRGDDKVVDASGWWADPTLLGLVGPALVGLHPGAEPTLVVSPESTGFLLGPLAAVSAGAGFVEMRRGLAEASVQDRVLLRSTPPDYQGRTVEWGVRGRRLRPGRRVLFVDDWAETAATAVTARRLVEDSGATWLGAAVMVDATDAADRRELNLRGLLRPHELG